MKKKEIAKKINEEGHIHAIVTFEVIGSPKEHVTNSLKNYIGQLEGAEGVIILEKYTEDPEEQEGGVWSTFTEAELLVENLELFTWMCVNFTPASIEIIEPENYKVTANELQNWLNDMVSRFHEVGTVTKQATADRNLLIKNMNALIMNSIQIALEEKKLTEKEIAQKTGIGGKLEPFLKKLVEQGKIKQKGKKYTK